jgi:hypothetical protein
MAWAVRSWHAGVCLGLSRKLVMQRMPGVLLAAMGLALFALVETEANYQVDITALSHYKLIKKEKKKKHYGLLEK